MQLVVPIAVMTEAMMLAMIWRMAFHVSLLFFMVSDDFKMGSLLIIFR